MGLVKGGANMGESYRMGDVKGIYKAEREYARNILLVLQQPNYGELRKILRQESRVGPKKVEESEIENKQNKIETAILAAETWKGKFSVLEKSGIKLSRELKNRLRTKSWAEIKELTEASDPRLGKELHKLRKSKFIDKIDKEYRINLDLDEDLPSYDKQYHDVEFILGQRGKLSEKWGHYSIYPEPSNETKEKIEKTLKEKHALFTIDDDVIEATNGESDYLIIIRVKRNRKKGLSNR